MHYEAGDVAHASLGRAMKLSCIGDPPSCRFPTGNKGMTPYKPSPKVSFKGISRFIAKIVGHSLLSTGKLC